MPGGGSGDDRTARRRQIRFSETYKVSGGLHGVGVSVVNALSDTLDLEIWRDGAVWEQSYERGKPINKLKQTGKTRKDGHESYLSPRPEIFSATDYSYDTAGAALARARVPE